ncbi:ORF30 [Ovine gammaherpesvirus 2]|uniref:ORF30 n=1 Tax=Ovine gammaherpesvirus 2 TaxID=10398 RepID=Q2VSL1_9GAMA|nr:ORF30 [Ovine gammaherpesvirus 2]AAX58065.1 ORF30 [Ovine gammaherpesvirus 2]ABB22247.1 hypothetical protein OvHV-2gp27 [Ovine gammaherpesvirus 2]WOZ69474.1 ORF30 hypothetical protein [Ovine gammaherpesvirus 2]
MKSELTEEDFTACLSFFNRPFPQIIDTSAANLRTLRDTKGPLQQLDLVTQLFDLAGAECVQEVAKVPCPNRERPTLTNVILPK